MNINEVFENKEIQKYINAWVEKTYYDYKLKSIIEKDDFYQDVNICLFRKLKSYDESKSSINTFIYNVIRSTGKNSIQLAQGRAKGIDKLDIKRNSVSMDKSFTLENGNIGTLGDFIQNDYSLEDEVIQVNIINDMLNMDSLSEIQKTLLRLLLEGYTKAEISKILNITYNTVEYHFKKSKEKIARKMTI